MTDLERAAYWATLTTAQKRAFIKSGQRLDTTSAQRMTAVNKRRTAAKGV